MPFVNGIFCCKAIFNFMCQIGLIFFKIVFAIHDKHRGGIFISILPVHFFLFYSDTFIVSVFVFISTAVYFCVCKDIILFIFQIVSQ